MFFLLYTFLVISFARCKEYMICLISFRKFPEVLPAFTCAKAIGNIQNICLEVSILSPRMSSLHHMQLMYHFEIVLIKFNNLLLRVAKFRKNFYCT